MNTTKVPQQQCTVSFRWQPTNNLTSPVDLWQQGHDAELVLDMAGGGGAGTSSAGAYLSCQHRCWNSRKNTNITVLFIKSKQILLQARKDTNHITVRVAKLMYITMGVTKSKENGCISVNFKIKRMNDHVNCKVKNELLCKFANQKQIVGDTSSKVYGNFRYMDKYIF